MESSISQSPTFGECWLVYDGECPFCSNYVRLLKIKDSVNEFHLINARDGGDLVHDILVAGLNLDEGMVLKIGDRFYHGDDCIHMLALLTSPSTLFNRLNAWVFASPARAKALYPVLRECRNFTLRLLGRRKIGHALSLD